MRGLYSHSCEYKKSTIEELFMKRVFARLPPPILGVIVVAFTHPLCQHIEICSGKKAVQIHEVHVFTHGRMQEIISGELLWIGFVQEILLANYSCIGFVAWVFGPRSDPNPLKPRPEV